MKWAALFSQTGSEICNLSEKLGHYPDLVISDNTNEANIVDPRIELNCKKLLWRRYKGLTAEEKLDYYRIHLQGYDIVTLHGWLNIVPAEICNEFKIYNGHPGLINYYPDLKGKDPVERVWENINGYELIGSVIHKVTAEIDGGQILYHASESTADCKTYEDVCKAATRTSFRTWLEFAKDYLDLPG
jgi:folate-dependent phosphoribosylglycinamide formyltransferase PurN